MQVRHVGYLNCGQLKRDQLFLWTSEVKFRILTCKFGTWGTRKQKLKGNTRKTKAGVL